MKRIVSFFLVCLLLCGMCVGAYGADRVYTDVPEDSWATVEIERATQLGLMQGIGDGLFGYGRSISRAEFIALLCRLFSWEMEHPTNASFTDVPKDAWYFTYIETALQHGVISSGATFSPDTPITREDMAVMLVTGLGYKTLAQQVTSYGHPFQDVTEYVGFITMAYDIGMIQGTGAHQFEPHGAATREQAAAILVRIYEKYISQTSWLHGFYAFSSYAQKHLTDTMDAVSLGWSQMQWDNKAGALVNTSASGQNAWKLPEDYSDITTYLEKNKTKAHLNIYMDTSKTVMLSTGTKSNTLREMLKTAGNRSEAVDAIIAAVTEMYTDIGKSPYSGVTIDFEGLRASDKTAFSSFLSALSQQLKLHQLTLYVAVPPAVFQDTYFDGYDFAHIGEVADKVILMAHDYAPQSLEGYEGTNWHRNTPLTPLSQVYYALRAITDPQTGVADQSKIALAISFASIGWEITEDNTLKSTVPVAPNMETVYRRMQQQDSVQSYSDVYRNPYMVYYTEQREKIFLWYENEQSVSDKLMLARLFGITGASIWRIGEIPNFDMYNAFSAF